jgi:hypothetical protein
MNKEMYTTIGTVMLTLTELIIAFVLLTVKSMTIAEAAAEGSRRDASPVPDGKDLSYETCAHGNTACAMLILAGIAEWDNKTRTRIRATEAAHEAKDEIAAAYREWFHTVGQSPDVAACAVAETEPTRAPSPGPAEAQAAFTVGTLVTYKPSASRANRTEANGYSQTRRLGIVMDGDGERLVQVNWGSYGTFWDRVANLEVLNGSR